VGIARALLDTVMQLITVQYPTQWTNLRVEGMHFSLPGSKFQKATSVYEL